MEPLNLRESTEDQREWMLRRLDFVRGLVESGAAFATSDAPEQGGGGTLLTVFRVTFEDAAWIAHAKAQPRKPYTRGPGRIGPPRAR